MSIGSLTLDLAYFAVAVLGDALRLVAGAFMAGAVLYSLVIVTIFMLRNE